MKFLSFIVLSMMLSSCASMHCQDKQGEEKQKCIANFNQSSAFWAGQNASNAATQGAIDAANAASQNNMMMAPPPPMP